MDVQLLIICLLTAGINLIGTLAYAARIAGVRTRRIAMSFALFNILVLVSRTSNSFLGPFLAKRIETRIAAGGGDALYGDAFEVHGRRARYDVRRDGVVDFAEDGTGDAHLFDFGGGF